jgi:hypothetical protein
MVTILLGAGASLAQWVIPDTEPGGEGDDLTRAPVVEIPPSYDSATSVGLPPDENPPVLAPNAPNLTFHYYQVVGTTLRGRNSTTGYQYDGVGCSHVTSGSGTGRILNTELQLPDDAVIKYLRVYYRDTNASNGVEGYITRYQPGVGTADLIHAGSSDAFAGGYGFVVSAEITETVNNIVYAYTLIGWPDATNVANQICGLRVAYYPPPHFFAALPTIRR